MRDRMRKERHLYFHAPMLSNPIVAILAPVDVGLARYLPASG